MTHTKKQVIIGSYSPYGYQVELYEDGTLKDVVYEAGNSPHDSQVWSPVESGLSLKTLRSYCVFTCKEIAEEKKIKYGGVQRDDELFSPKGI